MRAAHFNHPSHGAALSHVVTMIAVRRTRVRRLFRAKEEDKRKNRQRKHSSHRLSRAVMRRALLFLLLVLLVLTQILLSFYTETS